MVAQRKRSGSAAATVVAVGLIATTTGCTEEGAVADGRPPGDPLVTVRQAADALSKAGTSKASTSMEMATGGTRVTIRGAGVYDYRKHLGRLKVLLPQDASGKQGHRPITELLAPGALYMKNRGAGVPDDKWVRVDTASLPDGNLVTGGATDPMAAAELLRGAQEAEFVGETELAGTPVLHYRGIADIGRAAGAASKWNRSALAAAAKGFSNDRVPFEAYVDDEGRLRKILHRFSFTNDDEGNPVATDEASKGGGKGDSEGDGKGGDKNGRGSGGKGDVDVASTTLLYAFGTPVNVSLPASRHIYDGTIAES